MERLFLLLSLWKDYRESFGESWNSGKNETNLPPSSSPHLQKLSGAEWWENNWPKTSHVTPIQNTGYESHVTPTQHTGYESHVTCHNHNEAPGHTSRVTHIRLRVRIKNQYLDLSERKGHHNYCLRDNLKTLTSNVQSRLEDPGFGGWNAGERTVGHQLKKYRQDTISETLSHDFPPTVDTQPPHSDNTDGLTLY